MKKIVFVCHGNICRSPMAEFILKHMLRERGVENEFTVVSRATSSEEIIGGEGRPMYKNAREELDRNGIPYGDKTAKQLKREDFDAYDLFIGMDSANYRNMHRILGADEPCPRIRKLMDYTDRPGDVSDPWYSRRFDVAYNDIYDGCAALLSELLSEKP